MKRLLFFAGMLATLFCKAQTAVVDKSGNTATIASTTITIGETKTCVCASVGTGWILLGGQLISSLTASQQTALNTLPAGLKSGSNLVNAAGKVLVQGTLGAALGSSTITQANLPNVNLSGGAHTHSTTLNSWTSNLSAAGGERWFGSNGVNSLSTSSIGTTNSGNLSIPLGGTGAAYTPAAIGVNIFIYLGP